MNLMKRRNRYPHVHGLGLPCPACTFAATRSDICVEYSNVWYNLRMALEVKYWWGGTDPAFIDDEMGEVLDGQFWGPKAIKPFINWLIDVLDRKNQATNTRWTERYIKTGKKPPAYNRRQFVYVNEEGEY